jgi:hypothetical protein
MNQDDCRTSAQKRNLGSYVIMNPLAPERNPLRRFLDERKQHLPEKGIRRLYCSLDSNFSSSTSFPTERNSLDIIVWPLLHWYCSEKAEKSGTCLAKTRCLSRGTSRSVRMGENAGLFRPNVNDETSSSDLISGSLTV